MYRLTSRLIIYRDVAKDSILHDLAEICRRFDKGDYDKENLISDIYEQIHRLLDVATKYGFNKNLWYNYLAYLIATTETPFTLVSEKVGANDGSVNTFALNDFGIFMELFNYDFSRIEAGLGISCFHIIEDYTAVGKPERVFNRSVSEKVQELSASIESVTDQVRKAAEEGRGSAGVTEESVRKLYEIITGFYKDYGVGKFGLNKAFRVNDLNKREQNEQEEFLIPITATSDVQLEDLVGYELQKQKLIANTEAFVQGRMANNVLLYGDAGTGKSTSIKAVLNRYYSQGLRMIEVYKHQFKDLQRIISEIKNRNYRFIIYMDDLSFEEFEIEYKYLKAVIEGGLETKPDNVLIYATSNRRHLIRETWDDRSDRSSDDMHRSDTVQEKLSLVARFGVSIGYLKPSHQEYLHIVSELAKRYPEITLTPRELELKANQWELRSGGASGRTAQQFINYLVGSAGEQ
ncbi:MAG: ATP-binding protein [Lachnospiraceae bacterium]|nr:ATP-binding protein [Lachnospiraceae bacterium]